jgi:hypothetical protein
MDVCGDISDEDVISSDITLADIPAILAGLSMDDRRKVIKSKLTEINKDLTTLPVRMDEVQRGLPEEIDTQTETHLPEDNNILKQRRKAKLEEKTRIEAGGEIAELTKIQREIEAELQRMNNEASGGQDAERRKHQQNISELQLHITSLKNQIKGNQDLAKRNDALSSSLDNTLVELREEWATLNKQEFTGHDTCPTCKQSLPIDQVEAARAEFNINKSKRLEKIQSDGKIQRKKLDDLKAENDRLTTEISNIDKSITANQEAIKVEQETITTL